MYIYYLVYFYGLLTLYLYSQIRLNTWVTINRTSNMFTQSEVYKRTGTFNNIQLPDFAEGNANVSY